MFNPEFLFKYRMMQTVSGLSIFFESHSNKLSFKIFLLNAFAAFYKYLKYFICHLKLIV